MDSDFNFISSAVSYIVKSKGAGNYLKDESTEWVQKVEKPFLDRHKAFLLNSFRFLAGKRVKACKQVVHCSASNEVVKSF